MACRLVAVEGTGDVAQGPSGPDGIVNGADGDGFVLDDRAVELVSDGANTFRRPPLLGTLLLGARLTCAFALYFRTGDGCLDAGEEPASIGAEVGFAAGRDDGQAGLLGAVDPVFELTGLAGQAIEVPTADGVDEARVDVADHSIVGRSRGGFVGGADRLVDVGLDESPAAVGDDRLAVLPLAVDGQSVTVAVE